jgi:hypothetical protein
MLQEIGNRLSMRDFSEYFLTIGVTLTIRTTIGGTILNVLVLVSLFRAIIGKIGNGSLF